MCKINFSGKAGIFLTSLLLLFVRCSLDEKSAENIVEKVPQTEKKEFMGELPSLSVYHLPSDWTNQDGEQLKLEDLRGNIVVAVMIYTSCQAACPRLVADMKQIQNAIDDEANSQIKYVLVSIDPETDTPEKMKEFAQENEMDNEQWVFLRGSEDGTREFAATLAVNYKRISPIDFSHSNIISIFDQNGVLTFQKEGLEVEKEGLLKAIDDLVVREIGA